ncbi:unnamed protein product [Pleuronectes platessa]|uniref:Uncharacterized protein n=1 Tax=Pleuronectes platessa TaxID=8262 RepID=A0A9N7VL75_PLEPL|nr:unnamed protein product [Pleuronectes platessa]
MEPSGALCLELLEQGHISKELKVHIKGEKNFITLLANKKNELSTRWETEKEKNNDKSTLLETLQTKMQVEETSREALEYETRRRKELHLQELQLVTERKTQEAPEKKLSAMLEAETEKNTTLHKHKGSLTPELQRGETWNLELSKG